MEDYSGISGIEFEEESVGDPNVSWRSSVKEKVINETGKFFGIGSPKSRDSSDLCAADEEVLKWQLRRFRHLNKQYGTKDNVIVEALQINIGSMESLAEGINSGNDLHHQESSRLLAFPSSALFRSLAGSAGSLPMLFANAQPIPSQSRGFCSFEGRDEEQCISDLQNSFEENGDHPINQSSGEGDEQAEITPMRKDYSARFYEFCRASGPISSKERTGREHNFKPPVDNSEEFLQHLTRHPQLVNLDYRPFFSYWITTVQILIMLFIVFHYGIGSDFSNGFGVIERAGTVMTSSMSLRRIVVWEPNNVWIGPNYADLVHAGAKYTPCMRYDQNIYEQIQSDRQDEADNTGCCVRLGGCFQTSECPKQFATLVKWSDEWADDTVSKRTRVVCGQDPRYCRKPRSQAPFEWDPSNITAWPICEEKVQEDLIPRSDKHMHCEITGRPCCIQMHGQCRITTKEYCDFVKGRYHPNATLCSQVSCLNDVCGMTPFVNHKPDQIYRLVTPLFIHAGLLRCVLSIAFQMTIMRKFETMIGWLRISIIYLVSGIGGYLASSIFVPYMPEVGPAGSHGGVLGALIINILYNWRFLENPKRVLSVHLGIASLLFFTGLLPYIDNWAQLFGFVFGCLLAIALVPYFSFRSPWRHWRIIIVTGSLLLASVAFMILVLAFFAHSAGSYHSWSSLLNCPFSSKVCDHQSLILKSWLPI